MPSQSSLIYIMMGILNPVIFLLRVLRIQNTIFVLPDSKATLGTISSNQMNTNTDEEGTCWESWCFRSSSQSLGVVYNPLADTRILSALLDLLPWVGACWFWKSL